uniref:SET and MYND domain-containing protein 4-like n=1 Tax=Phallusia mammillata TaxID=59560 RepID=A0A6F9DTR6_9ASCI|nr:SET and MYND domain-containing protein 4-like [Phallusia mammillata]
MYCSDICRNKAWVMHHWLECCMWPVIYKSEAFAQMALRMILHGAYELYTAKFDKEQCLISGHTCSSIASHIKNSCITSKTNTTAKHKKKQSASQTTAVTGLNPVDNKYYGKYWSVYCLQTHFSDHGKARISKCESTARFLATVVEQCLAIPQPSPSKSKHATNIESLLNQVFGNLSFPAMHENTDSMFDIEDLRNQVKSVCEKFGKLVPDKNAKQQTYSVSKEMPKNSHGVLIHLIRHHMLQLYTNSQAVIQVLPEGKADKEVETLSQQRLALCVFPHCSLLNHSCDANTFVSFDGDRIFVKMLRTANMGDEICHAYGPCVTRYSYKDRQKALKEQYFFKCECAACMKHKTASSDEQALMDQLTAFKCNSCSGPVKIIESSRDAKSGWGKCMDQSCMKLHDLSKVQQLYIHTMEEVNLQAFKIMNGNVEKSIDVLLRSLKTLETILYKNHQTLGALHDQVAYCYSQNSNISMAIEHIIKSVKIMALKFGPKSIEYGREVYKLCALYFKTGQYFLAHKYLLIASPIFVGFLPAESRERKEAKQMKMFLDTMDLQLKLPSS